jgi:hypothetical protein
MRRLWLLPALSLVLLLAPAAAGAAPFLPPANGVFHGGTGGYDSGAIHQFGRLTGRPPSVYQYFFTPTWTREDERALNWERGLLRESASAGTRAMFALSTARGGHGGSVISPAAMASGAGDPYLLALNGLIADSGQVVYVRLMAEMNNFNNPYCAVDASGRTRGANHSPAAFRQAWRRAALILRGGSVRRIDRRLRSLGLPRVRTSATRLSRGRVALMWNPFTAGLPNVDGNGPGAYWPGGRYVDWVGTDLFANSPNFRGLNRFYGDRRWNRKPFMLGEWALWGKEDRRFVRRLIGWVRSHRRARMEVYNQGGNLLWFLRLRSFPRSARELRRQVRSRRFNAYPPELTRRPRRPPPHEPAPPPEEIPVLPPGPAPPPDPLGLIPGLVPG